MLTNINNNLLFDHLDGGWILGEAPEIANYYICAGMNGNSLQGAGGVGKAVADWMVY